MQRFRSILFSPLSGRDNPAAARRVADFASRIDASLTLYGVTPGPTRLQRALHHSDHFDASQEADRRAMAAKFARCLPNDSDIAVETRIATGRPSQSIIEQVLRHDHDVVIVTSDEDEEDRATINLLLRKCPCPVWVIRATTARTQRVLAAVKPDPSEAELNGLIVEFAVSVNRLFGGELHVAHAWELEGEATMRHSAFLHTPTGEIKALLHEEETGRRLALDNLLASTGSASEPWQVHLDKGPPGRVVPEVVARCNIDLLVIGTVARTGVIGFLIGNTAESVLDDVRCSMIAFKPPGFVSPIHLRHD